jgi:predicted DCC family thiol-disulfide oxidoreductase YuxK
MTENNKLSKPMLLYDGDCGFCKKWIGRWQEKNGDAVDFEPYQEKLQSFPQLNKESCEKAVQLVMPDGSITSGAHAVFKALSLSDESAYFLCRIYEEFPLFAKISERAYRWVSEHRKFLSKLS